jgi:hypothetical protein
MKSRMKPVTQTNPAETETDLLLAALTILAEEVGTHERNLT